MNERQMYEGRIKKRCLYLPNERAHERKILESIIGSEKMFLVSYFRLEECDVLAMYTRSIFEKKFKEIIHLPPYDSLTPEQRESAYWSRVILHANTEWTCMNSQYRARFDPYTLIKFYHLPFSHTSVPMTMKIDERVRVIHANDFLVIIKPEDEEKFMKIQSTVKSVESCPTSNNPNLAPASSHP